MRYKVTFYNIHNILVPLGAVEYKKRGRLCHRLHTYGAYAWEVGGALVLRLVLVFVI